MAISLAALLAVLLALDCAPVRAQSWRLPRGVRRAVVLSGGRLSDPQATCDVPQPQDQYITFPSFAQTDQEICGIWSLEDDAAAAYDALHGYPSGDPRAVDTGLPQEAGYVETFLEALAFQNANGGSGLSADDQGALAWLGAVEQQFQIAQARDALDEYDKWNRERCHYLPPNKQVFSYRPDNQTACQPNTSLANLYSGLTPPSEADFIAYGTYEADQQFGINGALGSSGDQLLIDQGITEGAGVIGTVIAGAAPQALTQVKSLTGAFKSFLKFVADNVNGRGTKLLDVSKEIGVWRNQNAELADAMDEVRSLRAAGVSDSEIAPDLLATAETGAEEMAADAGVSEAITEAVETSADDMSSTFAVAAIAITIAVTEGEAVFTAANIPNQLQANLSQAEHPPSLPQYVWNGLSSNSTGAVTSLTNIQAQMQFPQRTVGFDPSAGCSTCRIYDTPPTGATAVLAQLRMTALGADGTPTGWSSTGTTASNIDTWPMGAANGNAGVPQVSVAVDGGEVWTAATQNSAPSDVSEAGLSGYVPSGELRYFNAAGKPMIAYLHGDQFETLSNPGSIAAAGADAGDACATAGECTLSNSIVVMAYGGTPQLQDTLQPATYLGSLCGLLISDLHSCDSDTLAPDGNLVPAGGSTSATSTGTIQQKGTSQLYRLTIDPDTGTPAAMWIANQYNSTANDLAGGAPNGGLIAGQSVTFTDPEISPSGYATTYRWQIQSLCAYAPGHSPQTIQDVPVCYGSPDYNSITGLAPDEQDLASCADTVTGTSCNRDAVFGWTADPAFHGGAVTTLTGQSVDWTWPAPGTYHVRLITTDQQGISVTTDRDVVVSASSAPASAFTWSSANDPQPSALGPSVIGPVSDGNAVTLTGCVTSPDTVGSSAYSTPSLRVDWGDGSTADAGTAGSNSDPNLVFTYDPAGGCSTPWEYQVTHTYALATNGQPFVQVPIKVTLADVTDPAMPADLVPVGVSTSSSSTVYADVYPNAAKPSFVAGAATTFDYTAGETQTVSGYVTSGTAVTIASTPAAGVRLGTVPCATGLPSGMGFVPYGDGHYEIDGTPRVDAGGCYALEVSATNLNGTSTQRVIVAVAQPPAFSSGTSVGWATGSTGSFTVSTSGFPTPALSVTGVSCSPGCGSALPADISFVDNGNGTATLSSGGATIAAADVGVYTVTVSATGSSGTATQTLTLTIGGAPIFTSPTAAGFTTRQDGTFDINVAGSPAASISCSIVVSGSSVPCMSSITGYSEIDSDGGGGYELYFVDTGGGTAVISGAGNVSGEFTVTLTATNAIGSTQQTLSLYVSNTGGAQLTMIPGPSTNSPNLVSYTAPSGPAPAVGLARFIVGQPGTVTLCSDDTSDTLRSLAPLPAGLTITDNAGNACGAGYETITVSGTPTVPPTPGSTGSSANRIVSSANGIAWLTIELIGPPAFSSPSSAVFTEGTPGSFTASLGTGSYSNYSYNYGCLSESGQLPGGLSFRDMLNDTATISGTPTSTGTTTVTLTGTDCGVNSTTQQLTITVRKAPAFTSADSAGFQLGAGGTFTVTTNGDAFPVPTLSAVAPLPPGVSFTDNGDGTGTLTVAADAPKTSVATPITLSASSVAGTATQQLDLAVGVAPQITAPAASPAPVVMVQGTHVSYTVRASGVPAPALTCTVGGAPCSAANLPAGLAFTDNGDGTATIGGTPAALGSADVTVTARDGVGTPATTTLDLTVDSTPSFAGSASGGSSCASASAALTVDTLVANAPGTWTLCGSGSPAPSVSLQSVTCAGSPANLPTGVRFSDAGDGSATLSGTPAIGSGAACPGGYDLAVAFSNPAGIAVSHLTLKIQEVIVATSASSTAPFVPGAPNRVLLTAAGSPAPAFAVDPGTPLPSWMRLKSLGNGTAALTGTPPRTAVGRAVSFAVDITNDDARPLTQTVTVPVAGIVLLRARPPAARLGRRYSYRFVASGRARFSVAAGSALPLGLRLSRSGVLKGRLAELGRFALALEITAGGRSVSTGLIGLRGNAGPRPLEITQFRTVGPHGQGDWFVQVLNTTRVAIPLAGWHIGIEQPGFRVPVLLPLGTGRLRPGRTMVVAGTASSMRSRLAARHLGATSLPLRSGFQIVAPNGAVVDAAGLRGALRSLLSGRGLRYPRHVRHGEQYAFVRDGFASGHPVGAGSNARTFTFGEFVRHPARLVLRHSAPKLRPAKKRPHR